MRYVCLIMLAMLLPAGAHALDAKNVEDYLILNDIDSYKFITEVIDLITEKTKPIQGYSVVDNSGIIIATGHFDLDHADITYSTDYESDIADLGVEVQVTEHAGVDSDRWLLHEVERDFRNYYGIPGDSYTIRKVGSNFIIVAMSGGGTYRWLSGNKVIHIEYTDLQLSKPEPLDVIQAYLAKHPSTLPETTSADLRTDTSITAWIKDEMKRRLWLGDRWFTALQLEKAELGDVLKEAVGHMGVFLDYREKYYGISADEEKARLSEFLREQNGTGIKNRLEALKSWWADNKGNAINL